jgi:hypothetical protein
MIAVPNNVLAPMLYKLSGKGSSNSREMEHLTDERDI